MGRAAILGCACIYWLKSRFLCQTRSGVFVPARGTCDAPDKDFMIPSPFAKRRSAEELAANQRRSTRVDYVCPVVVSGRDATGQPFRVETETSTVNLHG